MKKRLIFMALTLGLMLTGCSGEMKYAEDNSEKEYSGYFRIISSEGISGRVIYDTRTGVEYWESLGGHNDGTLTLLVDADGNPLVYNKETKE